MERGLIPYRRHRPAKRRDDEAAERRGRRWYEEQFEEPLTDYEVARVRWRDEVRSRSGRPDD